MIRNLRILGTGKYLPKHVMTSEAIDAKLGLEAGTVFTKSGVKLRYFAQEETIVSMAKMAALQALEKANVEASQIDLIIYASAVGQQPIPCTAAFVQKEMDLEKSGIPCFDINSTCLSFLTALDIASYLTHAGTYKKILIVSSEMPSRGINWSHFESACLFGDGASAALVGACGEGENSQVTCSRMETYSAGAEVCMVKGGLTALPAQSYTPETDSEYRFHMEGGPLLRLSLKVLPPFLQKLLSSAKMRLSDLAMVVPHQASLLGLTVAQEALGIAKDKVVINIENGGNTVSCSIPMALNDAIEARRILRGDQILLLGTAAGISVGGVVLRY